MPLCQKGGAIHIATIHVAMHCIDAAASFAHTKRTKRLQDTIQGRSQLLICPACSSRKDSVGKDTLYIYIYTKCVSTKEHVPGRNSHKVCGFAEVVFVKTKFTWVSEMIKAEANSFFEDPITVGLGVMGCCGCMAIESHHVVCLLDVAPLWISTLDVPSGFP